MRQILEILRLRYDLSFSQQAIADAMGLSRSTVKDYLSRANAADISWPLAEDITNEQLNKLLFSNRSQSVKERRPIPDWSTLHKELKRKSVTLQLLWEEYKREHPSGYQYSYFVQLYRHWAQSKKVWMPQVYKAGEKVFVDYSGLTVPIWSSNLREVVFDAEIFVSVLGASDYIFCTATKSQQINDWINAHVKMFHFYGGVAELLIPDNLRSGVTKPHRYEPKCQTTYEELARHYSCAVMPTRTYKPKDKAKVEKAVQLVQQRVLAPIRDERFNSLDALNKSLSNLLEELNNRHSKAFDCSRLALFEQVEKSALRALPAQPYELALWYQQKVSGGYHITINKHKYSVPHHFARKKVDVRVTNKTVEVFYKEERVACHERSDTPGDYTTVDAHRPENHRQQAMWNKTRLQAWARTIGSATYSLIQQLFQDPEKHLHQKERCALGILRFSNAYGDQALENTCQKALALGTFRYDSIASLMKRQNLDVVQGDVEGRYQTPTHENVRGAKYYH